MKKEIERILLSAKEQCESQNGLSICKNCGLDFTQIFKPYNNSKRSYKCVCGAYNSKIYKYCQNCKKLLI